MNKRKTTIAIRSDLKDALRLHAFLQGKTLLQLTTEIAEEALERMNGNEPQNPSGERIAA